MRLLRYLLLVLILFNCAMAQDPDPTVKDPRVSFEPEGLILGQVPFSATLTVAPDYIGQELLITGLKGEPRRITLLKPTLTVSGLIMDRVGRRTITLTLETARFDYTVRVIPGLLSLIAPIAAIALALISRQMILSLFVGVWAGVTIIYAYNPISGFFHSLDEYIVTSLANPGHAAIVIFSLLFGGMIGIMSKNGSMLGIVTAASKYARSRRRGQIATSLMGVMIFFDDYSNSLLVGNTMRPFTDKLHISREKLSYIVDSTAAPVANLAFISTWSVFQMSLLDVPYANAGITQSPYITFLKSIPYGFYSIFALWLLYCLGVMKRDFGPMYQAEARAIQEKKVLRDGASPLMDDSLLKKGEFGQRASHWLNAIIPIIVVVLTTIGGLYVTGVEALEAGSRSLRNIIGNADSYASLMWGAALGGLIAIVLSMVQRLLSLEEAFDAWLSGIRSMMLAALVLVLAWTLGQVCEDLKTAEFIITHARDFISPVLLPIITFILAALISFSTGTSWGTMSILVPLIAPLAIRLTNGDINSQIFLSSFAAVLSGATFGDHCSPISDTTILSSMASGADHIDHVKTQIPYALTAAGFAMFLGYIPAGLGIHSPLLMLGTLGLIVLFVYFVGNKWQEIYADSD